MKAHSKIVTRADKVIEDFRCAILHPQDVRPEWYAVGYERLRKEERVWYGSELLLV